MGRGLIAGEGAVRGARDTARARTRGRVSRLASDPLAASCPLTATVSWVQTDRGEDAEDAYNLIVAPRREGVCGRDSYTGRRK